MLKRFEYDSRAIVYLQKRLEHWRTLGHLLFTLPLESGQVYAYLPATTRPEALYRFDVGGVLSTKEMGRELDEKITNLIASHLSSGVNSQAIFSTFYDLSDPPVVKKRFPWVEHAGGKEIYIPLTPQDRDPARILLAVNEAERHPFIGALTSLPRSESRILLYQEIPKEMLEELATRTTHILTDAYDSETYLIWSRV
jgi:hypothetical protein